MTMQTDVLDVNQAFYTAFAAGDYAIVEKLWAQTVPVSVIHPGSSALHGREAVMHSWKLILENSNSPVKCTNAMAYIHGATAYVVCSEVFPEGQLAATNIFIMEAGEWRLIHHQAGPDNHTSRNKPRKNQSLH